MILEEDEVLKTLRREIAKARSELQDARRAARELFADAMPAMSHPDGVARISQTLRRESDAQAAYDSAVARLTRYSIEGTLPE